jgi:hypothetical protein
MKTLMSTCPAAVSFACRCRLPIHSPTARDAEITCAKGERSTLDCCCWCVGSFAPFFVYFRRETSPSIMQMALCTRADRTFQVGDAHTWRGVGDNIWYELLAQPCRLPAVSISRCIPKGSEHGERPDVLPLDIIPPCC